MKLKKIVATAATVSALGFGAVGGVGVATPDPAAPFPAKPGPCGPHNGCWPGPGGPVGNPGNGPGWNPGNGPGWNPGNGNWNDDIRDFSVGSRDWWRGRPGKWWRDDDLPPWGFWGAPPPYQWQGPPPWVDPHPINYWGYNATPVWDDGFQGWGIWLFGVFIPIVGIGSF